MARRKKGREIDGVLLLDKASGLSSNKALQQVKHLYQAQKAGHTGALDPLASGLLPICLGQSTKIAQFLLDDDKCYWVRAKLGEQTDTGDSEGQVIATADASSISDTQVFEAARGFLGESLQVPPMYSALKKDGQPLYKLARQGIEVERKPRPVHIYALASMDYTDQVLSFEVSCSKGTYVRSLVEDIGQALGCGAHVVELRRTGFAHFDIAQALSFEALEALADDPAQLDAKLLPSEDMLPKLSSIELDAKHSDDISFGRKVNSGQTGTESLVKLFDPSGRFLGIGQLSKNGTLAPKRLFV